MTWRASFHGRLGAAALVLAASLPVRAEFVLEVHAQGMLDGAVVSVRPLEARVGESPAPAEVAMVQANRQFDPFILAVPVGVPVRFPNRDDTAHHVYSFSSVGPFELPLYKGDAARTVTFHKPGVVPLGCNIHDWMIGYIYVVDAPFFGQLLHDHVSFADLPAGRYEVSLWHPALAQQPAPSWPLTVVGPEDRQTLSLDFPFVAVTQPAPPVARFDEQGDY